MTSVLVYLNLLIIYGKDPNFKAFPQIHVQTVHSCDKSIEDLIYSAVICIRVLVDRTLIQTFFYWTGCYHIYWF